MCYVPEDHADDVHLLRAPPGSSVGLARIWIRLSLVRLSLVRLSRVRLSRVRLSLVGVGLSRVRLSLVGVGLSLVRLSLVGVGLSLVRLSLVGVGLSLVRLSVVGSGCLVSAASLRCGLGPEIEARDSRRKRGDSRGHLASDVLNPLPGQPEYGNNDYA